MKATIEEPQERIVTLVMTESEAKVLKHFCSNLTYQPLIAIGAADHIALKGETLFTKIGDALDDTL